MVQRDYNFVESTVYGFGTGVGMGAERLKTVNVLEMPSVANDASCAVKPSINTQACVGRTRPGIEAVSALTE